VSLRVPYPRVFFTKNVDGRIDDPKADWKGRGLWTTSGTRANFHGEDGKGAYPKVYKIPDAAGPPGPLSQVEKITEDPHPQPLSLKGEGRPPTPS